MQNWPNMSCQTKKIRVQQTLPSLWVGRFQGLGSRIATRYLLYRSDRANARYYHCSRRALLEGICTKNSTQQPTGKPFMPNWNSVQLFLGRLSWLKKSVSCLVNMDVRLQGHQKHVRKKKPLWPWQKGLIVKRLDSGMRAEKFSPEAKADVEHKVATMIEVYKDRLEKADWLAPETREKPLSNSMSSHHISATLKNYQKHMPKRSSTRARPWWKMLKIGSNFHCPCLEQVEPTSRSERVAHAS